MRRVQPIPPLGEFGLALGVISTFVAIFAALEAAFLRLFSCTVWLGVYAGLAALSLVLGTLWLQEPWQRWPDLDVLIKSICSSNLFMITLLSFEALIERDRREALILHVIILATLLPALIAVAVQRQRNV